MRKDIYAITLRLDGESMSDFGRAISRVSVEFPAVVLSDARQTLAALNTTEPDLAAAKAAVARIIANTESTARIGDGVAALIGMCQPERIDGGPVQ
jgi:predicted component of type VI protein secretion system